MPWFPMASFNVLYTINPNAMESYIVCINWKVAAWSWELNQNSSVSFCQRPSFDVGLQTGGHRCKAY